MLLNIIYSKKVEITWQIAFYPDVDARHAFQLCAFASGNAHSYRTWTTAHRDIEDGSLKKRI